MAGPNPCIFLLVASVLALVRGLPVCAPPEELYPCTCKMELLKCSNINDEQLRAVANAQREHGEGPLVVEISDYRMSYIPSGVLSDLRARYLEVVTSSLLSFHDPHTNVSALAGSEDRLTGITIGYFSDSIEIFDWSSLSPLKQLKTLFIKGSFAAIRTPLPHLPNVEYLGIYDTRINFIAENAFAGLTGIRNVRFIINPIQAYKRNMFPNPALKLTSFASLVDNVIELPEDLFENMPALASVELSSKVHNIPPVDGTSPVTITAGRDLTCDSRLKWLLRMRDESKVKISSGKCGRPENLRGRDVTSLTEEDL